MERSLLRSKYEKNIISQGGSRHYKLLTLLSLIFLLTLLTLLTPLTQLWSGSVIMPKHIYYVNFVF